MSASPILTYHLLPLKLPERIRRRHGISEDSPFERSYSLFVTAKGVRSSPYPGVIRMFRQASFALTTAPTSTEVWSIEGSHGMFAFLEISGGLGEDGVEIRKSRRKKRFRRISAEGAPFTPMLHERPTRSQAGISSKIHPLFAKISGAGEVLCAPQMLFSTPSN